jgi:hypothetical protein
MSCGQVGLGKETKNNAIIYPRFALADPFV